MTTLNAIETAILTGVLRDRDRLAKMNPIPYGGDYRQRLENAGVNVKIKDARDDSIVALNLCGWLGRPLKNGDAVASCRALARLESLGLIARLAWGRNGERTTHVGLCSDGEHLARKLARERRAKQTLLKSATIPVRVG